MVAEYEIMSFDDFKSQFGASGVIEYVPLLLHTSCPAQRMTKFTELELTLRSSRPSMCFTSDLPEHKGDRDRVYVYFCSERNVSKAAMKT